jgi:preprotein translocase SecF subunit
VFDIIGKKNWFFAFSLLLTIPGVIAILLGPLTGGRQGLQFAIDFTGGTVWSIRFEDPNVTPQQVQDVFEDQGVEVIVTKSGDGFTEIRTKDTRLLPAVPAPTPSPSVDPSASPDASASASAGASASPDASASPEPSASPDASASPAASPSASAAAGASPGASPSAPPTAGGQLPTLGKIGEIRVALEDELGTIAEQRSLSTVGAVVSQDLVFQALTLILFGAIGIVLWITYRFRDVKMGVTALISLLHDVIVVVGIFAILGTLFNVQIDSLFVTAMLTIIGFSVHDTIVVFDRIRENRSRHAGESFPRIVNHSILQTLGRSITTSLTVVIVLLSLLLFASEAIGVFVLALLLGIVSGTYSSIFNASPLLVVWHEWEDKRRLAADAARPSRRAAT